MRIFSHKLPISRVLLNFSKVNHLSLNNEIYIFTTIKFHFLVSGPALKAIRIFLNHKKFNRQPFIDDCSESSLVMEL